MSKHDEATLIAICENLADGMTYSTAAKCAGVSKRSLFSWLQASRNDDPNFLIRYIDGEEPIQFVKAANTARRIHFLEMRSEFERRCLHGDETVVTFGGKVQYREDPRYVGLDPDIIEICTGYRDAYERDEQGRVVPLTIRSAPPVAAVLRALAVGFPSEYQETTRTNSNVQISGGAVLGVTHLKQSASGERPKIPPPPKLPELEVLNDEDELQLPEMKDDPAPAETTDEPDEELPKEPEASEPEPVMIREMPGPEYTPPTAATPLGPTRAERSARPLSELEKDLLTRAASRPDQRSRPIGAR